MRRERASDAHGPKNGSLPETSASGEAPRSPPDGLRPSVAVATCTPAPTGPSSAGSTRCSVVSGPASSVAAAPAPRSRSYAFADSATPGKPLATTSLTSTPDGTYAGCPGHVPPGCTHGVVSTGSGSGSRHASRSTRVGG